MSEKKFTIKKTTVVSYKIRSNGFAWADITIDAKDKTGRISIASDYGNWQNFWGACGCPFNEFLSKLNIDYAANKFGADKWFDLEETIEYLKERITETSQNKKEEKGLLKELKSLKNCSGKEEFIREITECKKIMYMENYCPELIHSIDPGFKRFWKEIWPIFIDELKTKTN